MALALAGLPPQQSHPIQGDGHMAIALNLLTLLGGKTPAVMVVVLGLGRADDNGSRSYFANNFFFFQYFVS